MEEPNDRRLPPLLIVGGFHPLLTPEPLLLCRSFFTKRGRDVKIMPHGWWSMRCVERRAKRVAHFANRLMKRHGADRIDLLGFSMGGLASLLAVQDHGLDESVRVFLAYASPFQGVNLSTVMLPTLLFTRLARQLAPGSPLILTLQARGLPPGPRYISVAGDADLICPATRTLLPGAELVSAPFGHADFWHNRRLYEFLAPYLE